MTLFLDAIELATYIVLEEYSNWSQDNQRAEVIHQLHAALPHTSEILITQLTTLLHPIFVSKAERSTALSGRSVAARLIDDNDSFRLGLSYMEPGSPNPLPNVTLYADDIVISR
jgi:hypothetical protein